MDLRQLEYVLTIADTGSFTRAAEQCHVAQSALSRQVAQLEKELGSRLFHRTTREVRLTAAGSAFVPAARRVLAEVARARAEVDDISGVRRGQVRIGATQAGSRSVELAGLLGGFRRRYPGVSVSVAAGPRSELLASLARGDLDIVLAEDGEPPGAGIEAELVVASEPLVAVVSRDHPLAGQRVLLAELAQLGPFVEFRLGGELRQRTDDAFASAGLSRTIAFELGQIREMLDFAAAGLGTAIVPAAFTTDLSTRQEHSLQVVTLADPGLAIAVCAYTRPALAPPAARALLRCMMARDGANTR